MPWQSIDVGLPLAFQVAGSLHERFQPSIKIFVLSRLPLGQRDQRLYLSVVRVDLVLMAFGSLDERVESFSMAFGYPNQILDLFIVSLDLVLVAFGCPDEGVNLLSLALGCPN
jgi:hypothetical protein